MKIAVTLALLLLAGSATAQEVEVSVGQSLYQYYCETCHGATAEGDGPMSAYLIVHVPDLTGLARRNHGIFPMLEVIHLIDGRNRPAGHGGPMPVFSALFSSELTGVVDEGTAAVETQGRIMTIALYLEAIQK